MYPTRTTFTTGTLDVPPATTPAPGAGTCAPARHTRPTESPAGATSAPATDRPREASPRPASHLSETGPVPGAGHADRFVGSAARAGSHAAARSEEFPAVASGARQASGPAHRAAEPQEQAGAHAFVAGGVFDPLARVRSREAPAGASTTASAGAQWPRPTPVAVEPARSGPEYPVRGAAPAAESGSRYRETPAAFAEPAPSVSGSGAPAPAREADRSSEFRSGPGGPAGPHEAEHRVRVPAEARAQEYAGSQIQAPVPVPAGAPGTDLMDPASGRGGPDSSAHAAQGWSCGSSMRSGSSS
ncbi:hypothetical protein ACFVS6_24885, partial [Streptomyces sp. NPDC057939]